jgi:hypothetical protein
MPLKPVFQILTLIRMVITKCVAVRLGVIYDSHSTNRKQGRLPVRAPLPHAALLFFAWESYITPSRPKYTKIPPQTGGISHFFFEKSPKTAFLYIKTFNKMYNPKTFCEELI